MDKNYLLDKIEEIKSEFDKIQQRKTDLQKELVACDQEIYRIDGKYIAYDTMLKEIEAMEKTDE